MAFSSRPVIAILYVIISMSSFNARASDDEYLKMLDSEAEDVKLDQSGQLINKEQIREENTGLSKEIWSWEGDIKGDVLPPGLTQDELVILLKQHFYGTFVFYRKLNSIDQNTIYNHYQKAASAELEPIRQDILNHLKK